MADVVVAQVRCCAAQGCSDRIPVTDCYAQADDAELQARLREAPSQDDIPRVEPRDMDYSTNPDLVPTRVLSCTNEHVERYPQGEHGKFAPGTYAFCEVVMGDVCSGDAIPTAVAWRQVPGGDDGLGMRAYRHPRPGLIYGVLLGAEGTTLHGMPLVVVSQELSQETDNPCAG